MSSHPSSASPQLTTTIPQDVLNIQQLLAEYGFTADNANPLLINQIFSLINETTVNLLTKADLIHDVTGSKDAVNSKMLDLVLQKTPKDPLEEARAQFLLQAHTVNARTDIPPHPITTPLQSLPLPLSPDAFHEVQDDYSLVYSGTK